jgi:hypothetical protein
MVKRLFAIAFIFGCTTIAWMILGTTIFERTRGSDSHLRGQVSSTWGTQQSQQAPVAYIEKTELRVVSNEPSPAGGPIRGRTARTAASAATTRSSSEKTETVRTKHFLPLDQTRATVAFDLDYRKKGLLWYSTYAVDFLGHYRFRNSTASDSVTFEFRLPASQAIYDGLRITLNGAPVAYQTGDQALTVTAPVAVGASAELEVGYKSQGLDQWSYALGPDIAEVRDFELVMRTDFKDIDFPENTLSPTTKVDVGKGWELKWRYANLLSGFQIGMAMPQKLQPGPLAGQIAYFAPVSLLFFFAVMFITVTTRRIELHPMNYAFLAAGFFAFHLLLAYLVDHLSIHVAFIISSAVSIALVVSYLRLVVGPRFAFVEAALTQFVYLVLFSYAFFFKGFTGLAITIGSIITLFVAMQLTGRVRWSELLAAEPGSARNR